ncbi:MAG: hypothetical protein JWL90_871 [Chthoniobacteraceae bacterium]|nr:hypothetical protein [Chthoniobacteraceae bacterium]MDB6171037.1 hypothetical protein [Chthoniobacteraceae bacterium]
MIDTASQNPFALLTLIVAPAVLTNAMSVLALSTSNRFLRAGERLRLLAAELEAANEPEERSWRLRHINRIERQAVLLLAALRGEYVALGSFISASLVSIVGAGLASRQSGAAAGWMIGLALAIGFVGAGTLVWSCVNLFHATRLSMMNISEEASMIRAREKRRS